MSSNTQIPQKTTPCPGCGGSGETAFFGGESRFMLTREDCPDCCGTGILLEEQDPVQTQESRSKRPGEKS